MLGGGGVHQQRHARTHPLYTHTRQAETLGGVRQFRCIQVPPLKGCTISYLVDTLFSVACTCVPVLLESPLDIEGVGHEGLECRTHIRHTRLPHRQTQTG